METPLVPVYPDLDAAHPKLEVLWEGFSSVFTHQMGLLTIVKKLQNPEWLFTILVKKGDNAMKK